MSISTLSSWGKLPWGHSTSHIQFPWLHSLRWDLFFLIGSVCLSIVPFSAFLFFGGSDNARTLVNGLVTLSVAGPHMYATFNRTALDADFRRQRKLLLWSSLAIPIAVTVLIITQYVYMLTAFFFVASLHALHQVAYLTDCYAKKSGTPPTWWARAIDYGVIFSALYPWATYKMMRGEFLIGPVQLWSPFNPGQILAGQEWMVGVVFVGFYLLVILFIGKSVIEWRQRTLNGPKTLLIAVTIPLMYFTPLVDNLDTAFQGINVWHSFQYLAITWYVLRRAELQSQPVTNSLWVQFRTSFTLAIDWIQMRWHGKNMRFTSEESTLLWTVAFYIFQLIMLPISGLLFIFAHALFPNLPYAEQYSYLMILPILLIHYYHDAFLFTEPEALVD